MPCKGAHALCKMDLSELRETFEKCDVIIHQPISEKFGPLSTDTLRSEFADKTFISCPSIYFGGLFPYLSYLRDATGRTLKAPLTDYHDIRIVAAYLDGLAPENCLRCIRDGGGICADAGSLEAYVHRCIAEARKRDTGVDIPVMDDVMSLLAEEPSFYTFNHPCNRILWQVARQVFDRLGLPLDAEAMPRREPYLDSTVAAVPDQIARHLDAAWSRPDYEVRGTRLPWPALIEDFYALYARQDDFAELCRRNSARFPIPLDRICDSLSNLSSRTERP